MGAAHSLYKGRKRAQREGGTKLLSWGVVSRLRVQTEGTWVSWPQWPGCLPASRSPGCTSIRALEVWEGPRNVCLYQVPWVIFDTEVPQTRC